MRNYRQWLVFSKIVLTLLWLAGLYGPAQAAVNIDRTRIIFASDDIAQSLTLSNDNTTPMLLQVWTDAGNINASPDNSKTPLVALPPVFKMEPGELRTLRLLLTSRQQLATDRESLFWLNIYQIPPVTHGIKNNLRKLVLPLRLRLKILIRPTGLKAPTEAEEKKLRFIAKKNTIRIANPTSWYMSLALTMDGKKNIGDIMVAPKTALDVPLTRSPTPGTPINYAVINDSGSWRQYTAILERYNMSVIH